MGIGNGVRSNISYTSYTIPLFLPVAVPLAALWDHESTCGLIGEFSTASTSGSVAAGDQRRRNRGATVRTPTAVTLESAIEHGPGKYDDLCTLVREQAGARGAIVMIIDGKRGAGFSVQVDVATLIHLPDMLEIIAAGIPPRLRPPPLKIRAAG